MAQQRGRQGSVVSSIFTSLGVGNGNDEMIQRDIVLFKFRIAVLEKIPCGYSERLKWSSICCLLYFAHFLYNAERITCTMVVTFTTSDERERGCNVFHARRYIVRGG